MALIDRNSSVLVVEVLVVMDHFWWLLRCKYAEMDLSPLTLGANVYELRCKNACSLLDSSQPLVEDGGKLRLLVN